MILVVGAPAMSQDYRKQLYITSATWCLWELACVAQVKSIESKLIIPAATLSLVLPLIGFVSSVWWVEEKTWKGRLGLTVAGAAGAAMGTFFVMNFWK